MKMYFELLTEVPLDEVDRLLAGHLKEAKVTLAKLVIAQYHSEGDADAAAARWQSEIGGEALPTDIPEVVLDSTLLTDGQLTAVKLLTALQPVPQQRRSQTPHPGRRRKTRRRKNDDHGSRSADCGDRRSARLGRQEKILPRETCLNEGHNSEISGRPNYLTSRSCLPAKNRCCDGVPSSGLIS